MYKPTNNSISRGSIGAVALATTMVCFAASPALADDGGAGYNKGFFIASPDGDYKLYIGGRVQNRLTFERPDGGDDELNFSISRARLKLKGNVRGRNTKYMVQIDFGKGSFVMKDFEIDQKLSGDIWLRAGQWKRPTSREFITSSGKLGMVDRTLADKEMDLQARDIGVAIHNNYLKSPKIEWVVGVFNGSVADKPAFEGSADPMTGAISGGKFSNVPDHFAPMFVGRVGFNANGIKGYEQADLEGGGLRFAVGGFGLAELDTDSDDKSSVRAGVDFIAKHSGISATGALYIGKDSVGDTSATHIGAYAQGGLTLAKTQFFAARIGVYMPDGADNNQTELTAGHTYFMGGHSWKLTTDAGAIIKEGATGSTTDILVRSQLQLAF